MLLDALFHSIRSQSCCLQQRGESGDEAEAAASIPRAKDGGSLRQNYAEVSLKAVTTVASVQWVEAAHTDNGLYRQSYNTPECEAESRGHKCTASKAVYLQHEFIHKCVLF